MNGFRFIRLNILAAILAMPVVGFTQQSLHSLQIESPADGMIVNPGQSVTVRVTSRTDSTWSFLGVLGKPFPPTEIAHSVPAEFSMSVPPKLDTFRRYTLTAMGRTVAGELVESDPVDIDVERPDTPVSISSFQFPRLTLQPKDPPLHLIILATFPDLSDAEVTESSYVSYASSDTAVATVDQHAAITPTSPGSAAIIVTYKNPNGKKVQVSVPVTVLPTSKD